MARKGASIQRKISDFTYTRPSIDKRLLRLKKNFNEVSSILNETKKHQPHESNRKTGAS